MMNRLLRGGTLLAAMALVMVAATVASATTIAQNSSWTVTRPGATETLRAVAYGDSIFAGYISIFSVTKRSAPHVHAEYMAALYGQNIQTIRRAQSGAVASGIYSRINSATDRAFMETANTRVVAFEMCGNDYLQARSSFVGQSGTCNYNVLTTAFNNCQNFTNLAIQNINTFAHPNVKLKIVGNLYYPGYDADNVMTNCNDPVSGAPINRRSKFLPLLAESNWMTCNLAEQYGWECADTFAEFMGGDYDSNGDGIIDSEALRYRAGDTKDEYVQRILDLQGTLRDSNLKMISSTASADYLLSDNTHPTHSGQTGSSGTTAVQYPTAGPYPDNKNPVWNIFGHDRYGFSMTYGLNLEVDAGPDATILECETFESSGSFVDKVFFGPYDVTVDYGDGFWTNETTNDTTVPLEHQYVTTGVYEVEVQVVGPYSVMGSDTATVTVRSAENAVQDLIDAVNALQASGALKTNQANGLRQPLISALSKLGHGQDGDAQNMINDFISKVASSPLSAANKLALTELALRAYDAAGCSVGPVGPPPYGRTPYEAPEAIGPEPEVENETFGDEFDPECVLEECE
jgi:hypothetical protein